jgi:hypothetical protein
MGKGKALNIGLLLVVTIFIVIACTGEDIKVVRGKIVVSIRMGGPITQSSGMSMSLMLVDKDHPYDLITTEATNYIDIIKNKGMIEWKENGIYEVKGRVTPAKNKGFPSITAESIKFIGQPSQQ